MDHFNSQAVIKQEKDENNLTNEAHASINRFPDTLHSPSHLLTKGESSIVILNSDTCQVKTEPESEDEQSWEEEITVDHRFRTAVKQEITDVHKMDHRLQEDDEKPDENQLKTSEFEDNGEKMIKHETVLHHDSDVMLKNIMSQKVPDIGENESTSDATIEEIGQQQLCNSDDECHTCRFCGRNFKSLEVLNKHVMSHPNDYACTYACDYCKKAFKSKNILNRHKARQHSKENLCCDICGKSFVWQCQLKSHKEICRHSKERPYVCDVCGKAFKQRCALNQHEALVHVNRRPHVCDVCGKAFKKGSALNRHQALVHLNVARYTCDTCGKAFKEHSALNQHESSVHLNIRTHVCDMCGKAFNLPSTLHQHIASVHLKERPHTCDVCGMAFKRIQALKEHKEARHVIKEAAESCDVCGKTFKLRSYLLRHKKRFSNGSCRVEHVA